MNGILLNQVPDLGYTIDSSGAMVLDRNLVVDETTYFEPKSAVIASSSGVASAQNNAVIGGSSNSALGAQSVIINGYGNENYGEDSVIIGGYKNIIESTGINQVVMGKYNSPNASDIVQIGGGTSNNNRKNIFTIDNSGTVTIDKTKMTKSGFYLQANSQNVAGMELKGSRGEIFGNFKGNFIGPALEQISAPLTKTEYTFTGDESGEETVISAFEINGTFRYEISSTEMISSPTITLRISNGNSISITDKSELESTIMRQLCNTSTDYSISDSSLEQDFYIADDFSIKKCSFDAELPEGSLGVFQLNLIRQAVENYDPESSACVINIEFIEVSNDELENTNSIIGAPVLVANGYIYTDTILNYVKRIIKTLSSQGIILEELE